MNRGESQLIFETTEIHEISVPVVFRYYVVYALYASPSFIFCLRSANSFFLLIKSKFSHSSHECLSPWQSTLEFASCLIKQVLYKAK